MRRSALRAYAALTGIVVAGCAAHAPEAANGGTPRAEPHATAPAPKGSAAQAVDGGAERDVKVDRALAATVLGPVRVEVASELQAGEVELAVSNVRDAGFGELTRRGAGHREADRVRVDSRRLYPFVEPADSAARACSFVIDCDTPEVAALAALSKSKFRDHPTITQLEQLTSEAIPKKNLSRSFDVASVVARRGEGDCTEHAVLLAALARSAGMAARVVTGIVLVSVGENAPIAAGHAWVEVHTGGAFHVADAALVDFEKVAGKKVSLIHLPISIMSDETPAFARGALKGAAATDVTYVRTSPVSPTK
jgi:Transglutaminase-like superfamily